MHRNRLITTLISLLTLSCEVLAAASVSAQAAQPTFKALIFSKTAGFRHTSIRSGIVAIQQLGRANSFTVDATEDARRFTDASLSRYDVVIWLSTTGNVLNAKQQRAFERYIQAGGVYVGVHAAADTEYDWPWYGRLVGTYFKSHPAIQQATVNVVNSTHPSTVDLPQRWQRTDEWYNYRSNPRGRVRVLATLDEKSYSPGPGAMGTDHPIAWCHNFDGGQVWYTGGGHTSESFSEPLFRKQLLGGIQTAAGAVPAGC